MNSRFRDPDPCKNGQRIQTWTAVDESTGTKTLIKRTHSDAGWSYREQAKREAEVLSRLPDGPYPRLVGYEEDLSGCTLTETFLEEERLDQWMDHHPSRDQKLEVYFQILHAIGQVHQAGYLYLDLKPSNILIHQNEAFLIDFNACVPIGFCRPVLVNRQSLPPECLKGKPMDERADQIGLGALFLFLFGPSRIAFKALAQNPDHRFSSLAKLEQAIRSSRSSQIFQTLLSMGLVVLVIAGLFFLFPSSRPSWIQNNPWPTQSEIESFTDSQWLECARKALDTDHVSMGLALLDHLPNDLDDEAVEIILKMNQLCGRSPDEQMREKLGQILLDSSDGLHMLADSSDLLTDLDIDLPADSITSLLNAGDLSSLTQVQIRNLSEYFIYLIYSQKDVPSLNEEFVHLIRQQVPELELPLQKGILSRQKGRVES